MPYLINDFQPTGKWVPNLGNKPPPPPIAEPGAQADHPHETANVLDQVLEGAISEAGLSPARIASWVEQMGILDDGRQVRLSPSCLLQPNAGDQVLVWTNETGQSTVLSILVRQDKQAEFMFNINSPLTIEAPVVSLNAGSLRFKAEDFLSYAKRRFAVEHTRSESIKMRVAQLDLDIRRAGQVSDHVEGSFLQRAGTWISNTVREARHKARTFLFD